MNENNYSNKIRKKIWTYRRTGRRRQRDGQKYEQADKHGMTGERTDGRMDTRYIYSSDPAVTGLKTFDVVP